MVPAGRRRRDLHQGRRQHVAARGGHAGHPRADPRRPGPSAGRQPHRARRLGEPDRAGRAEGRRHRPDPRVAGVLDKPFDEVWGHTRLCGEQGAPKPPDCWNGSPYQPIPVTDDASTADGPADHGARRGLPRGDRRAHGDPRVPAARQANAAHILGYLGPVTDDELEAQKQNPDAETRLQRTDLVGRLGLEAQYDEELRGSPGVTHGDHRPAQPGHRHRLRGAPTPGNYLVTSIDAKVQAVVEKALLDAIKRARTTGDPNKRGAKYKADSGAAVVMDVNTGRIVAMASYPTYDPNVWVGGISKKEYDAIASKETNYPNQSRAIQGQFAPASTFKVISTSAAVEAGYSLNGSYPCPSAYPIGNRSSATSSPRASAPSRSRRAIEVSCDTVFYKFAYETWLRDGGTKAHAGPPRTRSSRWPRRSGSASAPASTCPARRRGRIADRQWKYDFWEAQPRLQLHDGRRRLPGDGQDRPDERGLPHRSSPRRTAPTGYVFRAGDAVNFAIGQGDTPVTPLQMARVYAAVANGGTLYVPTIGKAIVKPDGTLVKEIKPQGRRQAADLQGHADVDAGHVHRGHPARRHRLPPVRQRRLPARPDPGRQQDRHRRGARQAVDVVVRLVRAGRQAAVRRRHDDQPGRHRQRRLRPGRRRDLQGALRRGRRQAGAQQGVPAAPAHGAARDQARRHDRGACRRRRPPTRPPTRQGAS